MSTPETTPLRLLVVDGDDALKESTVRALRRRGEPVSATRVEDAGGLDAALAEDGVDLVLLQPDLPGVDPAAIITAAEQPEPPVPVLLLGGSTAPVEVGARDRVDPDDPEDLTHRLRREAADAVARRRLISLERRYQDSERRAHELVDRSRDAIAYVQEGILVHANPAFRRRLGEGAEPEGTPLLEWLGEQGRDAVRKALRRTEGGRGRPAPLSAELLRPGGHHQAVRLDLRPADYQGEPAIQLTLQSGDEEGALRQRVRRLEHQDPITGLFNRQHFLQSLEALAPDRDEGATVICLSVDHFEDLRARLNPAGADALLARVAERLWRRFSPRHHLARFQGPRFTALLEPLGEPALARLGQALCRDIADDLFEVGDHSLPVSASVGIACWDGDESPVELLERAFQAAREAADSGGNGARLAAAPDHGGGADDWLDALEQALAEDRLVHVFQPVGDVRSAATHGGELLVRLRDREGTLHPPGAFLSAARRGGLMPRLDRLTLDHAARRLAAGEDGPLFVKVTAESLEEPEFPARFREQFGAGAAAGLVIELAESDVVAHLRAAGELAEAVRAAGGALALEHFGTAPDGEAAQERLRADYLKIDGEIVGRLDEDPDYRARLEGIVRLAGETGATTIAERVESARTLPLLWQAGVDRIQGYFLHAPEEERATG
ncbi:MAG: EAL domain-containing protein [Thiohalospira sp.]